MSTPSAPPALLRPVRPWWLERTLLLLGCLGFIVYLIFDLFVLDVRGPTLLPSRQAFFVSTAIFSVSLVCLGLGLLFALRRLGNPWLRILPVLLIITVLGWVVTFDVSIATGNNDAWSSVLNGLGVVVFIAIAALVLQFLIFYITHLAQLTSDGAARWTGAPRGRYANGKRTPSARR